jgi:hypothetical protein
VWQGFIDEHAPLVQAVDEHRQWLRDRMQELGGTRQDLRVLDQFEQVLLASAAHVADAVQDPALRSEMEQRMRQDVAG